LQSFQKFPLIGIEHGARAHQLHENGFIRRCNDGRQNGVAALGVAQELKPVDLAALALDDLGCRLNALVALGRQTDLAAPPIDIGDKPACPTPRTTIDPSPPRSW